jgi:DNA-binding transcriptional MerR regulator
MNGTLDRPQTSGEYISIGEAAERTGLTQRTLRYYEELGLLKPPARVSGGQRLYSAEDLARVERILAMKRLLGFSLTEIKAAVEAEEAKRLLCADVKRERSPKRKLKQLKAALEITARQLAAVEGKIAEMRGLRDQLKRDLALLRERMDQLQAETERPA